MASDADQEPVLSPMNFSIFFPVFFGVMRAPPLPEGISGPAEADRLVMLNPFSQRMVVLNADGDPFAVAMRAVLEMSEAEGGNRGPPPASKASILALRTVEEKEIGEADCAVCLEELWMGKKERPLEEKEQSLLVEECLLETEDLAVVKEMPCGHCYHQGCIGKWLQLHGSCPVCRYRMPEEEEGDSKKVDADLGGEAPLSQQSQQSQQEQEEQQQEQEQDPLTEQPQ